LALSKYSLGKREERKRKKKPELKAWGREFYLFARKRGGILATETSLCVRKKKKKENRNSAGGKQTR